MRSAGVQRDAGELQVLLDREILEDPPVLGHERQPLAHEGGRLGAGDRLAVETNGAAGRAQEAGDGVQQRGLAGAVRADERDHLTDADGHDTASSAVMAP